MRSSSTVIPCPPTPTARQARLGWLGGGLAAPHWLAFWLPDCRGRRIGGWLAVCCGSPTGRVAPPLGSGRRLGLGRAACPHSPPPSAPGRESHSLTPPPALVVAERLVWCGPAAWCADFYTLDFLSTLPIRRVIPTCSFNSRQPSPFPLPLPPPPPWHPALR